MKNSADIIIIGGGAIGLLTALELHDSGADVLVVERGATAKESTWAGGGILSPLYPWRYPDAITQLAAYSQQRYKQYADYLLQETGLDPEYVPSGFLIEAGDEIDQAKSWLAKWRVNADIISAEERKKLEPELTGDASNTIWMPDIAQLRNPRFGKSVKALCDKKNIAIIEHTEITEIKVINSNKIQLVSKQINFDATKVIVASGAWSSDLLKSISATPEIKPVKGEMLIFKCPPDAIKRIHLQQDRYSIPRRDGRVLFGSTVQEVGYNKQVTASAKEELKNIAIERFPILKDCPIEYHWAGLRPGTPDSIPLISAHPEHENLFINAGHFRNGLVLGLASARLMKQMINGEEMLMDPSAFSWK